MTIPYFKYSEIKELENTTELNKFVAQFLLDFSKRENLISNDLLDEEIELLFFKICDLYRTDKKSFSEKNKCVFQKVSRLRLNDLRSKTSLHKLNFPNNTNVDVIIDTKFKDGNRSDTKRIYFNEDTFLTDDIVEKLDYFVSLIELIEYRFYSESGMMYDKKKNGYKVFIEFKRNIKEIYNADKSEIDFSKEKGYRLNYKLSLLEHLDVLKWLDNNIPNKRDSAEILAQIIGGSPETIKDYLDKKNVIKTDIKSSAIKFITDKKYK